MKKGTRYALLCTLLLSLSACGHQEEAKHAQTAPKAAATDVQKPSTKEAPAGVQKTPAKEAPADVQKEPDASTLQKVDTLDKQLSQLDQAEQDLTAADQALAEQDQLDKELNAVDSATAATK